MRFSRPRAWWVAHLLVAAGATALIDVLGVAGYRSGFFLVTALLLVLFVGPLLVLGGPGLPKLWLLFAGIMAAVAAGVLVDRAPYSAGRLAVEMDRLPLPDVGVLQETRRGNSRCRPACPQVTRTYDTPQTSARASIVQIALALEQRGFGVDLATTYRRGSAFAASSDRMRARVDAPTRDGRLQLVITFTALKP